MLSFDSLRPIKNCWKWDLQQKKNMYQDNFRINLVQN